MQRKWTSDVCWYPQTPEGDGDGVPLQVPPGGLTFEADLRLALAVWASERNIDHAVAVREDGRESITIWINNTGKDWEWNDNGCA